MPLSLVNWEARVEAPKYKKDLSFNLDVAYSRMLLRKNDECYDRTEDVSQCSPTMRTVDHH